MQGLMGNYLEQSKNLFTQMQEQMAKQAEHAVPGHRRACPAASAEAAHRLGRLAGSGQSRR